MNTLSRLREGEGLLPSLKPLCSDKIYHALAHLPQSLELTQIHYTRAGAIEVQNKRKQFREDAKPAFLKHLSENHETSLKAMGLNQNAIEHMGNGNMPENINGQQLDASIDHILSLNFSGTNEFENLALLPMRFNALKDKLENLQLEKGVNTGTLITIIPKNNMAVPFIEGGFQRAKGNV